MGCGGSVQVAAELKSWQRQDSTTLDEARRRREEGANARARRASLMCLLEAEKIKARKFSTPSMQGSSVSDISEIANVKIPTFEPNISKTPKQHGTNNLHPQIEIMISPSSRPGSAVTRELEGTKMDSHEVGQIQENQKSDRVKIIDLEETEEDIFKRRESEDIVRKAIRSAFSRISVE